MATTDQMVAGGVSFALTEEQKGLRSLAREFAEKEIRPVAAEYDEHSTHPADVIAKAHEVGLMNPHISEEYGGLGLSIFDGILIGEELAWGCAGIAVSIVANQLGAAPVMLAGTDEQKQEWLPPLVDSPILCSFALTEPNAGSDVSGIQTTAVRHGREYVVNGSKMFITNAGHASWIVVFASTDKSKGHRGLSAFVVPADADGVTIEKHLDKMGQRATDTSAVAFQDVKVPARNRLGEEGDGFKVAMRTLDHTRPGTAAGALGVARAAYEHSVRYSRERVQFGQPIAMNQGVNFLIADMAAEIEAGRLLTWQAAWLLDRGERATLQSSYAKRFASDTAMKVTTDAVQIFGGYGYMKEYPVEKLMRDAKLFQIYEGTSQIQRLVIADIQLESAEGEDVDRYGPLAQAARAQGLVYTESTAREIEELGRRSLALRCDVTEREQVFETVERVVDELGSVDILVNNAGTLDHLGQLPDQSPELWERDLRVNLTGAFNCAQAVWPHMKERGWGRIVNMASVAGTLGGFGQASYSTTKAGLLGLTRTLALEGARHGITCNAIVPGIIGTEAFHFGNPEMNERMVRRTAMRRAGEPQDVANAIAFLCSDLASYITGVALNVSGGIELFTF